MMIVYGMTDSGNCYKPRLMFALLDRPFRHVEVDTREGATRKPEFLSKNPNGKVPLLELDDGRVLAESNAILLFLAEGTPFVPTDSYERALVHQWLFFEQYSHEPNIAVRRSLLRYTNRARDATPERLASLLEGGNRALAVMEGQLKKTPYIAGADPTVARFQKAAATRPGNGRGC